jgi:hypothetical protein
VSKTTEQLETGARRRHSRSNTQVDGGVRNLGADGARLAIRR